MASANEILAAAQAVVDARANVALATAAFDAEEATVQSAIAAEREAYDAAQLVLALAQDAARAATPGWAPAVATRLAAEEAEAIATAALFAMTFDGT